MKRAAELVWIGALLAAAGAAVIAGCAGQEAERPAGTTDAGILPPQQGAGGTDAKGAGSAGREDVVLELSGSQLWAQNCAQCHNNRSPSDYSDVQWEVAVMHMRVQARLTGEEERKIVQFLKASN